MKAVTVLGGLVLASITAAHEVRALEPDGRIAIRIPTGVQLRNVALGATGAVNLADRSLLGGPALGVGSVANVGPGRTQLGVGTRVGTNVASAPQTVLASNARIAGALLTTTKPTLQPGASIAGGTTTNAVLAPPTVFAWSPPPIDGTNDFTLFPDATGSLAEGSYQNVIVYSRARLTLGAGVYEMNALDLEPQATVTLDNRAGPIVVYVGSNLILRGTVVLLGSPSNFAIVYEGANAVNVETAPWSGALIAPYATLRLAAMGTRQFKGQFFGHDLVVDPDVQVTYAPFNWDLIQPLLGGGTGIAGTQLHPPFVPVPLQCFAPSFTGTTQTSNGATVFTSLHFAGVNPDMGICEAQFCDGNGNRVPGPTEAELNLPPKVGSTCSAVLAGAHCPVDTTSLTTPCSSDADCGSGGICASRCVDTGCTAIEHRCGKPAATCAGLAAESNCDEFRLCPEPGAVGTPNRQALLQQLPPTSAPNATGTIAAGDRDIPPAAYTSVAALQCASLDPTATPETLTDGSDKPAGDGSKQWGIFVEPVTSFSVIPIKRTDGIGELNMKASGGVSAGGIIFGTKVEVLGADIGAVIDDCGVTLNSTVKLFGEAVATFTPSAGKSFHLATSNGGGGLATPDIDATNCRTARQATKDAIKATRKSNILARAVSQYYLQNGLTSELCNEIQGDLGKGAVTDASGQVVHCDDVAAIPVVSQINILNAWKSEYDGNTAKYVQFSQTLGTARQAIQTSGTIDVFKSPHPYSVTVLDQDFPLGPVTLNLAVEGFGSWDIAGGIQFGLGVSGDFKTAKDVLKDGLHGQDPGIGDIRAFAGPVITPDLQAGVLAYVGVGIPGVSVGIQGQLDLLDISLPTGVVVAVMRLAEPDPRPVAGTDFAGTPIAGMESKQYRWVTGYTWGSKLALSELNGEVDLAVRIHFLFFKHTFKKKIVSWPGLTIPPLTLVGGGGGDALAFSGDYGKQADNVAYTAPMPGVTDNPPKVVQGGPPFCQPVVK